VYDLVAVTSRLSGLRTAFAASAVLWALSLPAAAFAAAGHFGGASGYPLAAVVYGLGSLVCHQRPDRSFELWASQMPVCARCAGIYAGAALTAAVALVLVRDRGPARLALALAVLPSASTLVYEWTTGVVPGNWTRAIAGAPIGAVVAWLVLGGERRRDRSGPMR
jgi:uncharacterized membrane protein